MLTWTAYFSLCFHMLNPIRQSWKKLWTFHWYIKAHIEFILGALTCWDLFEIVFLLHCLNEQWFKTICTLAYIHIDYYKILQHVRNSAIKKLLYSTDLVIVLQANSFSTLQVFHVAWIWEAVNFLFVTKEWLKFQTNGLHSLDCYEYTNHMNNLLPPNLF